MLGLILAISLFIGGTDQLQEQQPRPRAEPLVIGTTYTGSGFFCRTRQSAEQLQRAHAEGPEQGNTLASFLINTGQCGGAQFEYTVIEAGEPVTVTLEGREERLTVVVVGNPRQLDQRLYMLTINPVERGAAPPPRAPSI